MTVYKPRTWYIFTYIFSTVVLETDLTLTNSHIEKQQWESLTNILTVDNHSSILVLACLKNIFFVRISIKQIVAFGIDGTYLVGVQSYGGNCEGGGWGFSLAKCCHHKQKITHTCDTNMTLSDVDLCQNKIQCIQKAYNNKQEKHKKNHEKITVSLKIGTNKRYCKKRKDNLI